MPPAAAGTGNGVDDRSRDLQQQRDHGPDPDGDDAGPPAAVADDARQAGRVAGGDEPLEELLDAVDRRQQARRGDPDGSERPAPLRRATGRERLGDPRDEAPRRETEEQHEPGREGVEVGVPLGGELRRGV